MLHDMSRTMRKPAFYICENIDADQQRSNCAADQRLCFYYIDSNISLLPKSVISSLYSSSVAVQPGLFWTWSEISKTCFATRLIYGCGTDTGLLNRISCYFNSMSGNKLPTGFIQIKLILGFNSYDKMQLYDR